MMNQICANNTCKCHLLRSAVCGALNTFCVPCKSGGSVCRSLEEQKLRRFCRLFKHPKIPPLYYFILFFSYNTTIPNLKASVIYLGISTVHDWKI